MNNSTLRPAGIFLLMLAMLTWTDVRSWDFCQPNKDGIMLYYNYLYDGDACEIAYCEGAEYECVELDIPDVIILSNKNELLQKYGPTRKNASPISGSGDG